MTESDADFAFSFLRDEQVAYARTPAPPQHFNQARSWVTQSLASPTVVPWILEDELGVGAGFISLQNFDPVMGVTEVGFLVIASARRRGLATAALRAVTEWTFANQPIHRMYLVHDVTNTASCRAALTANYPIEGTCRSARPGPDGTRLDCELHAITRADVEKHHKSMLTGDTH